MRRIVTTIALLILVSAALLAALWYGRSGQPGNPPIQFSDGTSLRLHEVTYGTNHVHGSLAAKLLNRLPRALAQQLLKPLPNGGRLNSRTTSEPRIVLWMEYSGPAGTSTISRHAMLRPEGGFLAGKDDYLGLYLSPANTTAQVTVEFGVWPRRSKFLECAILEYSSTDGSYSEVGSFRFRNRSFFEGAKWNPEPLPATNRAGDLEVTLLDFVSGIGNGSQRRGPDGNSHKVFSIRDGREARAMVQVEFNSPRDTNETWCMFDADLGDATGNHLGASSRSGMSSDMTFDPILWPDEPAWKLKLHLKRKNGFQPEEWVTFTNIAIPQIGTTNMLDWTNSIMGIELVLKSFVRRPDLTNRSSYSSDDLSQIRVEHPKLGESNQLDLLSIVVQPANTNLDSGGSSWSEDFHEFSLQGIPANATHLDVTFSVQPTRYVEFTVAPNWVTNDYELTGE